MIAEIQFLKEIQEIANEAYGVKPKSLKDTINSLDGASEELDELLWAFKEKYDIDMSQYNYFDYFYEDNFFILNILRQLGLLFKIIKPKPDLTFEHLFHIAKNKKWENPFLSLNQKN